YDMGDRRTEVNHPPAVLPPLLMTISAMYSPSRQPISRRRERPSTMSMIMAGW
ncbi:MAG: hypothetical protein HXO45_11390, partial [Prevotella sp.]|nr:hypothetical protein [Prevotella sp.]